MVRVTLPSLSNAMEYCIGVRVSGDNGFIDPCRWCGCVVLGQRTLLLEWQGDDHQVLFYWLVLLWWVAMALLLVVVATAIISFAMALVLFFWHCWCCHGIKEVVEVHGNPIWIMLPIYSTIVPSGILLQGKPMKRKSQWWSKSTQPLHCNDKEQDVGLQHWRGIP